LFAFEPPFVGFDLDEPFELALPPALFTDFPEDCREADLPPAALEVPFFRPLFFALLLPFAPFFARPFAGAVFAPFLAFFFFLDCFATTDSFTPNRDY
jgi:hypothetical protein